MASPPAVSMASPLAVRMASLPVAAHPSPVPAPRQRPPVPNPRKRPPVPALESAMLCPRLQSSPKRSAPPIARSSPYFPQGNLGGVVGLQPERRGLGPRPRGRSPAMAYWIPWSAMDARAPRSAVGLYRPLCYICSCLPCVSRVVRIKRL